MTLRLSLFFYIKIKKNYNPSHVSFCFWRQMTPGEQPGVILNETRLFAKLNTPFISEHENNKFICPSNMFFRCLLLIIGAENFELFKNWKKYQKKQGWTRVSWYIFLYRFFSLSILQAIRTNKLTLTCVCIFNRKSFALAFALCF